MDGAGRPLADPPPPPATGRRRLWQLPEAAREVLVAWSLPPDRLRLEAARALRRLHRRVVVLQGSDADVLASVLQDLGQRNVISEALQAALSGCHAAAMARWNGCRDPAAQDEAWASADGASRAGMLWTWMTAPGAESRDAHWLAHARALQGAAVRRWAEASRRDDQRTARIQELSAALAATQARLARLQVEHAQARAALALELAQARGTCDRWRARALAAEALQATDPPPAPAAPTRHATGGCPPTARRTSAAGGTALAFDKGGPPGPAAGGPLLPPPEGFASGGAAAGTPTLVGQRILCVGGMPGAHRRYQALVEQAGARFAFHDGGLEHGGGRLGRQLAAADLVVCQAGCLNHEAYQRVKRHCQKKGTPCVFVERPSLAHFERALRSGALQPAASHPCARTDSPPAWMSGPCGGAFSTRRT